MNNIDNIYNSKDYVVVLFTNSMDGGVVQLTNTLSNSICSLGYETHVFHPEGGDIDLSQGGIEHTYPFARIKDMIFGDKEIWENITNTIIDLKPTIVIFTDNWRSSRKMVSLLKGKCKTLLTIHDVKEHPTNKRSVKSSLRIIADNLLFPTYIKDADDILLLSKHSLEEFINRYPNMANKANEIPLAAHPVNASAKMPSELYGHVEIQGGYLLFFGRIDKYKGIGHMLRAARNAHFQYPLVIAGAGSFSKDEQALIEENCEVITINRFIDDGEMVWLFQHCTAVVLPYVEATQSGVLVMAYHYGKPVICSNLPGLSEFVEAGKTGFLCSDEKELGDALLTITEDGAASSMQNYIAVYEDRNLNWKKNIQLLFKKLNCGYERGEG